MNQDQTKKAVEIAAKMIFAERLAGRADKKETYYTDQLHLPAGIPAKLFWAVTIYNPADGSMPETGQPLPSRNQMDKVSQNADGSVDLYFSPNGRSPARRPVASPANGQIP